MAEVISNGMIHQQFCSMLVPRTLVEVHPVLTGKHPKD